MTSHPDEDAGIARTWPLAMALALTLLATLGISPSLPVARERGTDPVLDRYTSSRFNAALALRYSL